MDRNGNIRQARPARRFAVSAPGHRGGLLAKASLAVSGLMMLSILGAGGQPTESAWTDPQMPVTNSKRRNCLPLPGP